MTKRLTPDTKCGWCEKVGLCLESLAGFICESCHACTFKCTSCGEIMDEEFIIVMDSSDQRCPICLEDNFFRQLEVF